MIKIKKLKIAKSFEQIFSKQKLKMLSLKKVKRLSLFQLKISSSIQTLNLISRTFTLNLEMSEKKSKTNVSQEILAKLYLALDDLTLALATTDDENVRKSEVFQKALEVVKVVKEMRRMQVKTPIEENEIETKNEDK